MFSGVPNPTFTPDAPSVARLLSLVSQLAPAPDALAPSGSDLGFRGFVVHGLDLETLPGDPLRVRGDGVAVATEDDRQSSFIDPGNQLYALLRELALEQLPPEVATHIPAAGSDT